LKQQRERLVRAMRTYGPPLEEGARRRSLELSAVSGAGVREALRAALAEVDRARSAVRESA
jgi:hypothetical protein